MLSQFVEVSIGSVVSIYISMDIGLPLSWGEIVQ